MATIAGINRSSESSYADWFLDFLKKELAPYPGRGNVVARMVISATITMMLIMTFRIPVAGSGPIFAFMLSRESLVSTTRSTLVIILTFAAGAAFVPIGAIFYASEPWMHFMWQAVSLFTMFFLLSALSDFTIAVTVVLAGSSAATIWYLPGPAELNVEHTLWAILAQVVGVLVTLAVEVIFHAITRKDEVLDGLTTRLTVIAELLQSLGNNETVPPETQRLLTQLAMVGAGTLRRRLTRSGDDPVYRSQMTAVVQLTARSVDLAAAIAHEHLDIPPQDCQRARELAKHIANIKECLAAKCRIEPWAAPPDSASSVRLLPDLERMIALIPNVFEGSVSLTPYILADLPEKKDRLFREDAFRNPAHIHYAMSGCLAAMLCYVFYTSLAWPGLSTSVVTCLLTGLSDIGSSRQKQILRLAGAIIGGFILSMGAQIFVLPYIDSIVGFSLLFAAITTIGAWVATSSPRLSYCGLQMAYAYFLVNLNEFTIQTSLSVARDRAIGVLLGISMMWLVFERFHPKSAATEMIAIFTRNLRLMAQLTAHTAEAADPQTIAKIRRMRDEINQNFSAVSAQSDAVLFETGAMREQHIAAREKIRRWQAELRTFYLMELPLLQFRVLGVHSDMPEDSRQVERQFQQTCAEMLISMADCLDQQAAGGACELSRRPELEELLDSAMASHREAALSPREQTLIRLSRNIASLLDRLREDMLSTPFFAPASSN